MSQQNPITISDSESSPTLASVSLPEEVPSQHSNDAPEDTRLRDVINSWIGNNSDLTPYQSAIFVHNVGMLFRHLLNVTEMNEGQANEFDEVRILFVDDDLQLIQS